MQVLHNPVIEYLFSSILYLMWIGTPALIFPRRFSRGKTAFIALISVTGILMMAFLPLLSTLRVATGELYTFLIILLLFRGRWYSELLVTALSFTAMLLSEFLVLVLVPSEAHSPDASIRQLLLTYLIYMSFNALLLYLIVRFARKLKAEKQGEGLSLGSLLFFLFPISQLLAMNGWFMPASSDMRVSRPAYFLLTILLFIAADLFLAYSLRRVEQNAALRMKNEFLEAQMKVQADYYASLTENYQEMRQIRHDIDSHLYTIRALLSDRKTEDAARYAEELYETELFDVRRMDGCGNVAVASFLLHQKQSLADRGIRLNIDTLIPTGDAIAAIPDPEIIRALGNLLGNAAEACEGQQDAEIRLSVHWKEPYLVIRMENPVSTEPRQKERRIPELTRGLGTEILQKLADEYDGQYSGEETDGEYRTSLILKGV